MEKSRLGISINLFAALLYFIGAGGGVFAIAVAASYVLLVEESERLKRTALKALILIVFFAILTSLINWLTISLTNILNALSDYNSINSNYVVESVNDYRLSQNKFYLSQFIQSMLSSISYVMRVFEILIPVIFGLRAYKEKDIKIKWIDNLLDKNFYQ